MRRLLLAASLTILACRGGRVGMVVPSPGSDQGPAGHTLTGRVADSRSGQALIAAVVTLDGPAHREFRVDTLGQFVASELPSGRYRVRTRHLGYYPGSGALVLGGLDSVRVAIGLDMILICLDACGEPTPTPGYVRVLP